MGSKKGGQYEREICKKLSLWWTKNRSDDVFWRSASSGGRATNRKKQGKKTFGHHGDVCLTNPIGKPFLDLFCLEVKRGYSKFTFQDLFDRPPLAPRQIWEQWIEQAGDSWMESGAYTWMIIARRDKREPLVMTPYCPQIRELLGRPYFQFDCIPRQWVNGVFTPCPMLLMGTTLDRFLRNRPARVLEIAKEVT